ncbi:von Willebrand factor A domain-containing protein 7-like [Tiliqua scincoides]|uniref:von Willebrand factor A domain-containing protein 7-like n=1 Tax=Tiliqua scincoides TaxID=71010 RepID=UPI003461C176
MLLHRGLPLLICVGIVSGFRPNRESGGISKSDFTDADITEMGALRAVAWFWERNPLPDSSPMDPGELENMKPLTASGLFKAYFEADVSASRFVKALQEIVAGNNQVEIHHLEDSSYFFQCEEIVKSITKLRALRNSMLSSLKSPVTQAALESARLNAGKALHVLQKFYSNTNWVELGRTNPYEHMIKVTSSAFPVARHTKKTCKDCNKVPSGGYECNDNILVNNLLTSGYKVSRTCRTKPRGKCGHGGRNDDKQNFSPTGGINKETSDPLLSPHYHLHKQAAELAVQATRDFFVGAGFGLLDQVGPDTFQKFFSLEGYSLTFVIDTTGSMSDDIAHVKTTCIKLLREYHGSSDAPFNYILVPFNDPEVGPVRKTNNVDEFESYISALKVDGGGDCPEKSLTGLKLALQESSPSSKIFLYTDAGANDKFLLDEIKVLVRSTGSVLNFALTGRCDSRKRRSVKEPETSVRSYANLYEELAAYSGGYYVMTTKGELSQVLGIMELSLNAAPVKVAHRRVDGTRFSFPVDETLTEITVSVKSLGSPGFRITVLDPSGASLASPHTVIDTPTHKVLKVSPVSQWGLWAVTMSPSGPYEVEIGGKSLLDFSYQIMQKQNEYVLPVQGRPIKGSNYTVSMKLMGDAESAQIQHLVPVSEMGNPIDYIPLNQTSDALGNPLAIAPFSPHAGATLLKVEGLSPGHMPFSRINTDLISTESVQIVPLSGQNGMISPGESLDISVLVVNTGAAASFSFNVWDDLGFLRGFRPSGSYLNAGGNVTLTATFVAAVDNSSFASSIATFAVKSSAAQNYLKLPISVIPETALETDETPPVHKLLHFYMPCVSKIQHKSDCSQHFWRMKFSAKDAHSAVTVQVKTDPSGLSCSSRTTDDKDVICHYQSNCCSPYVEFLISDENGNTDTLTVDFKQLRSNAVQVHLHLLNLYLRHNN